MSDLISREKLIDWLTSEIIRFKGIYGDLGGAVSGVREMVKAMPSAETEQKKGKWVKVGHWGRSYKCNQCGNYLDFDGVNAGRGDVNFCPNCGSYNGDER